MPANPERSFQLSRLRVYFSLEQFAEVEEIARALVSVNPEDEDALLFLAQSVNRQGRAEEAIPLMEDLFMLNPMQASYHNDYGAMLASLEKWPEAEAAYRMALVLDSSSKDARFNLALALFRQQQPDEALKFLEGLFEKFPDFADPYALHGEILLSQKHYEEAVIALNKAVKLGLVTQNVLIHLGSALYEAGLKNDSADQKNEALVVLHKAGVIGESNPSINFYLGNISRDQENFEQAIDYYRMAIATKPDFSEAHNNLGVALSSQGKNEEAREAFERAIAVDPDCCPAYANLGARQTEQGHLEAAEIVLKKALELSPDSPVAHNNIGQVYLAMHRLDDAEKSLRKALSVDPELIETIFNLGLLLLARGQFKEGWAHYEARRKLKKLGIDRIQSQLRGTLWTGEMLNEHTLLIFTEQGFGDNIQFFRYLRLLRERYPGARIYYWCSPALVRLFKPCADEYQVELMPSAITPDQLPGFDYLCPLLSLPGLFGTTLETIPANIPYLTAPLSLIEHWGRRLSDLPGKRVGIVWTGSEKYGNQKFRSMQLAQLKRLLDVQGICWVSLQKGNESAQIADENLLHKIVNVTDEISDFADTAAIIANLDLVISVDTAVAHLAGAVGAPVWLLNRFNTDWRWLLDRNDSPWYPTMRIFRQPSLGDWNSVVVKVHKELQGWVEGGESSLG